MFYRKTLILASLFLFLACSDSNEMPADALYSLLEPTETGIDFENKVENETDMNIFKYRNFYNGGGVAIGDINNDGLSDVYFTSNQGENKLYLNKGNFKFEDISTKAGVKGAKSWSTGVVMVDINGDGLLDIYVCNAGSIKGAQQENELFINNGNLTFSEKAKEYNLSDTGITTHAAFFDYDKDGDLDCYILNNSFIPVSSLNYSNKRELRDKDWQVADILKGGGDKLLRNDNGKFVDVSEKAGIFGSLIGFGLGVTVGDINNDLYPDIYISNDFYERDYLYINQKNGTFKEEIQSWAQHISQSAMGADMADINNDGKADIFVTDMLPEPDDRLKTTTSFDNYDLFTRKLSMDFYNQYMQNTLQLNSGNQSFTEIAHYAGVSKTDWSWGALLFDMDNDGYKDIYVCNGIYKDLTNQDFVDFFANDVMQRMAITGKKEDMKSIIDKMPSTPVANYAFKNNKNLTFSNEAFNWGFATPSYSNGAAYGDLDNDGDLDLIVNNVNMKAFVYKNNAQKNKENHFLKIKLKGEGKNPFAVGSVVELFSKNEIIRQELIPSRGFQSSIDYTMTFGLGNKKIDSLHVIFPNGKYQSIKKVSNDKTLTFSQKEATLIYKPKINTNKSLFSEQPNSMITHVENDFIDFDYEGLISKLLSQEGPSTAVADINGDQIDDVYIGGAKGSVGKVYISNGTTFTATKQPDIEAHGNFEDTAASLFDVDNDGDNDLLVGTGGNEKNDAHLYLNRLYLNDGKGIFKRSSISVPSANTNVSVIAPYDFDSDGDMDVFIGSRSIPGTYGVAPKHLLLENDGNGKFTNVINFKANKLKDYGMITDAKWEDIDNDNKKDLVVVGDWAAPLLLKNLGKKFVEIESNLSEEFGFWNTISCVDVNKDGKKDLIIGNSGTNTSYKCSKENPMKLFVNDFDNNGTIEQISTRTLDGKDMPIHLKGELAKQIPSIKKENLSYDEYAKKSIQEIFDESVIENSQVKMATSQNSIVAINKGNGQFQISILPSEVQFSSVNAICALDLNKDGNMDLILGGNQVGYKPQFGSLDASKGSVLFSSKSGKYSVVASQKSGIKLSGAVKAIKPLKNKGKIVGFIAVANGKQPKIFKIND